MQGSMTTNSLNPGPSFILISQVDAPFSSLSPAKVSGNLLRARDHSPFG
jgi:hypothetical protein